MSSQKPKNVAEAAALAAEVRSILLRTVSATGGHLASNLGTVEITVALHSVFDFQNDFVVWDTGHQAYSYKILTGRKQRLVTLKQTNGLSGFLSRAESRVDHFGAGHAGTALSACLGFACARDLESRDAEAIAVIGDAALGCGITLEAFSNLGQHTKRLVVILNDNGWSIDRCVGALARNGAEAKDRCADSHSQKIKAFCAAYDLHYMGPCDGHDVAELLRTFNDAKHQAGSVLVHCRTKKGFGYDPAAASPGRFHSVGSFDLASANISYKLPESTTALGAVLTKRASDDRRIVAISAAMVESVGLGAFMASHPGRCFDVGIAEEHATVFAAGLAAAGYTPFLVICSTFLQRAYDCILHDIALQKLPVRICIDRAGLSPGDGPTHHGIYDISFLRCIPNLTILEPSSVDEMEDMLEVMINHRDGPIVMRYGRCLTRAPEGTQAGHKIPLRPCLVASGKDGVIFCTGEACQLAGKTRQLLASEGLDCSIVSVPVIKPLPLRDIFPLCRDAKFIVSMENNASIGGFGSALQEGLSDHGICKPFIRIGYPDVFLPHGKPADIAELAGMTETAIAARIVQRMGYNRQYAR
jgi:1-deoxy-D-xylulose-5-phosphate synthase